MGRDAQVARLPTTRHNELAQEKRKKTQVERIYPVAASRY